MSQISYSLAGVTPPGSGTPNDNAFFLALFNALFAAHNDTDATVAAATPNATANALVKRGTQGEANLGYFAVVPPAPSTSPAAQILLPAGHTGLGWYVSLAGAMTSQMDAFGNLTMGGTIKAGSGATLITDATGHLLAGALAGIVGAANGGTGAASPAAHGVLIGQGAGAMTTVAPGTAGNLLTSNGTDWASAPFALPAGFTLPFAQIADYKPGASASAGVVTIAAGGAYADSTGAQVGPLAQQTASLPAQPTGTNIQYVAVSLAPGTGTPTVTGGPVGAAPAKPTVPVGNDPVAMVTWRGAATLPSGIVAAADIADIRLPGGGGGGAGGGGTGLATTAPLITDGDYTATAPNSKSIQTSASRIGGSTVAGSGVLSDQWGLYLKPDFYGRIGLASGASVTIGAGASHNYPAGNNLTFAVGGLLRTVTADTVASAAGKPAGTLALVIDSNPANAAATFQSGPFTLSATQYIVAYYYFDGTNLYDNGSAAFKTIAGNQVYSPQVAMQVVSNVMTGDTASASYPAYTAAANVADSGLAIATTANLLITTRARVTLNTTAAGGSVEGIVEIFNAQGSAIAVTNSDLGMATPNTQTAVSAQEGWLDSTCWYLGLTPGSYTFGLRWATTAATVTLHARTVQIAVFN